MGIAKTSAVPLAACRGSRLCKPTSLLLEISALGALSRTVPSATSKEASGVRGSDVEVGPTINPKQNSKRPRVSTHSSTPWLRARRSPLLDSIGQMQMASRYTWPPAAISTVKICTQTRHRYLAACQCTQNSPSLGLSHLQARERLP
jgi:hypothetical protein